MRLILASHRDDDASELRPQLETQLCCRVQVNSGDEVKKSNSGIIEDAESYVTD